MSELEMTSKEGVATITLAAPQRRNALTAALSRQLIEACEELDRDTEIGAVVITGRGSSFCSGASRELLAAAMADPLSESSRGELLSVYESFVRFGELGPLTIAAVNGAAVGAGVNLALAADLRIIAEDARIIPGFQGLGLHPGGGHFALVNRLAGRECAAAMGAFGEQVDGLRARKLGLAWEALPGEEVLPRAAAIAKRVAGDPALARAMSESLRNELGPPSASWQVAVQAETAAQMWSMRRAGNKR